MDWSGWREVIAAIVSVGLTGCGVVLWSLYLGVKRDVKEALRAAYTVDKELAEYKTKVAETYVTQNDLTESISRLNLSIDRLIEAVTQSGRETREGLSEIHRRIDGKADK